MVTLTLAMVVFTGLAVCQYVVLPHNVRHHPARPTTSKTEPAYRPPPTLISSQPHPPALAVLSRELPAKQLTYCSSKTVAARCWLTLMLLATLIPPGNSRSMVAR